MSIEMLTYTALGARLSISPQAIVLVSGMMLGAGTDYAVFLISRYHEYLRIGEESDAALVSALG